MNETILVGVLVMMLLVVGVPIALATPESDLIEQKEHQKTIDQYYSGTMSANLNTVITTPMDYSNTYQYQFEGSYPVKQVVSNVVVNSVINNVVVNTVINNIIVNNIVNTVVNNNVSTDSFSNYPHLSQVQTHDKTQNAKLPSLDCTNYEMLQGWNNTEQLRTLNIINNWEDNRLIQGMSPVSYFDQLQDMKTEITKLALTC